MKSWIGCAPLLAPFVLHAPACDPGQADDASARRADATGDASGGTSAFGGSAAGFAATGGVGPHDGHAGGEADSSATDDADTGVSDPGRSLWNGVDLTEWDGDPKIWRVDGAAIVGYGAAGTVTYNTFLIYRPRTFSNFVLRGEIWLQSGGNSGFQYRSVLRPPVLWRVGGYQADAGQGYWGMLFEELGRKTLAPSSDACLQQAGFDQWNAYEITARGANLVHRVNGIECVNFDDSATTRMADGILALQYHRPGGFEVRFRNLRIWEIAE